MTKIENWLNKQPFIFCGEGCLFTNWFKITDKSKIKELKQIEGVQIDIENMRCRKIHKLKN